MEKSVSLYDKNSSHIGFFFLFLYTIALFIRPQEWSYTPDPTPFARYFLMIAFVFFLASQRPKQWGYQSWFLLGVMFLIPISGLWNGWLGGGVYAAIDFFIYGLLPFFMYASLVNSPSKQNWIFFLFTLTCIIMLHHGLSQRAHPEGIGWSGVSLIQDTRIRYVGIFNDPNDMSMFFLMNLPILFYLRANSNSFIMRLFYLALVAGLLYGIFLANSRGALIGLIFMCLTYCFFQFGTVKAAFISLITLPLTFVAMSLFREISTDEASAYGRIEAWYEGVQMFKSSPLFGVGMNQFIELHQRTAHNSYVLIFAELGIIGYTLWFATIVLTMMMLLKVISIDKEKYKVQLQNRTLANNVMLAKCYFYSLVGFMATSFFLSRSYIVFLYIFLGLSYAVYVQVRDEIPEVRVSEDPKIVGRIMLYAPLSMFIMYLIIIMLL
ncbi:O-antigen ligase family protein [Thalassotalea litorea]|uniref:O-antigen ligase family protein n=1 Tax=Thalassotalea litorea TaxID=2020715 RepID=UPI0037367451